MRSEPLIGFTEQPTVEPLFAAARFIPCNEQDLGAAGFEARCPEAPDLAAYGETPAEAQQEIKIAVCAWLEILAEDGLPLSCCASCASCAACFTDFDHEALGRKSAAGGSGVPPCHALPSPRRTRLSRFLTDCSHSLFCPPAARSTEEEP